MNEIKVILRWDEWKLAEIRTFMDHAGKHPQEFFATEAGVQELIMHPEAAAAYLWVGMHRDDPALSVADVMEAITPAVMIQAVNAAAEALELTTRKQEIPAGRPTKARATAKLKSA